MHFKPYRNSIVPESWPCQHRYTFPTHHLPPRRVLIPRSVSSAAITRRDDAPPYLMSACTGAKSSANTASFVDTTARSATPPLPVRLSASAPFGLPNLTPHALATASASLVRRELDLSKFRSGPVESKIRYQWSDHGSDDTAEILSTEFTWESVSIARTSGMTSRIKSPIEVPLGGHGSPCRIRKTVFGSIFRYHLLENNDPFFQFLQILRYCWLHLTFLFMVKCDQM